MEETEPLTTNVCTVPDRHAAMRFHMPVRAKARDLIHTPITVGRPELGRRFFQFRSFMESNVSKEETAFAHLRSSND